MKSKILIILILSLVPMLAWSQGKVTGPKKQPPAKKENLQSSKSKSDTVVLKKISDKVNDIRYKITDKTRKTAEIITGENMTGNVEIPETINIGQQVYSVTSIGQDAFMACHEMTSISIPRSIVSIGKLAFAYCTNLLEIKVDSGNRFYTSINGILFTKNLKHLICYPGGLRGSYVIPDTVNSIEDYAFCNCEGLSKISIPSSVTSIGKNSFSFCEALTHVCIPSSVSYIGEYAFACCRQLSSVSLPSKYKNDDNYHIFMGCSSLTTINYTK